MDYSNHDFLLDELKDCAGTDIIEFGTYSGSSIVELARQVKTHNIPVRKIFTVDSFQGLPAEKDKIPVHNDWTEGSFNAQKYFCVNAPEECICILREKFFRESPLPIEIIRAKFSELNKFVINLFDIRKFCYINVDCDLYTSTVDALSWIFDNNLLATNALVRYDDYHSLPNGGEALAHKEICEEYELGFEYLDRGTFRFLGKTGEKK